MLALVFLSSILLWGALAQLAVEFVSMMLGELSEHAERLMLLGSAVLWLPLAICMVWSMTNSPVPAPHDDGETLRV